MQRMLWCQWGAKWCPNGANDSPNLMEKAEKYKDSVFKVILNTIEKYISFSLDNSRDRLYRNLLTT